MATPLCPYFGTCGGCSFQHVDYNVQLEQKRKVLEKAINNPAVLIQIGSGNPYGYRNRMDFVFHQRGLGLKKKGNWREIVDIDTCAISEPLLNKLLKEVRDFFKSPDAFNGRTHTGTLRYAVIRTTSLGDSSISFILNKASTRLADARKQIEAFAHETSAKNILIGYVAPDTDLSVSEDFFVLKGCEELEETFLGKRFRFAIQGFFQNNHQVAEKMHEYVHGLLKNHFASSPLPLKVRGKKGGYGPKSGEHNSPRPSLTLREGTKRILLDLYGGVGTFGILNAPLFQKVITIESVPACTESAKKNAELNGATNVEAITLDLQYLKRLIPSISASSKNTGNSVSRIFTLLDPPRSGMHPKTILALKELAPDVLIYISCNALQLGKDLPKFLNYEVKSAALFDLFPHTPHSEAVVELVRKE